MIIYVMFHKKNFMTIMDSIFFNIICFSFNGKTRVYYFKNTLSLLLLFIFVPLFSNIPKILQKKNLLNSFIIFIKLVC